MKYNFNDHFEMLYLRHDYVKRCKNINKMDIRPFNGVIQKTAKMFFYRNERLLTEVGMSVEDVASVTSLYAAVFLDLYSMENNKEKKEAFLNKNKTEVLVKDKSNMVNFLRQKLTHFITVCQRKSRNITGVRTDTTAFAATKNSVPGDYVEIKNNHKALGYRKVGREEFKNIKKNSPLNNLVDDSGFEVVVNTRQKEKLGTHDYRLITSYNSNNRTPEDSVILAEEEAKIGMDMSRFQHLDTKKKKNILRNFINKQSDNSQYKEEVATAKKMLKCI